MSSVAESLEKLRNFAFENIAKIEDSAIYEQAFAKWESLEPSQQKTIATVSRLIGLGLIAYLFISPLTTLWSTKSTLSDQRTLLAEMKVFNSQQTTKPRPASPPRDWQNMPAGTTNDAQQSITTFMSSIGLPEGTYQALPSSAGQLQITIPETNLRQTEALLYQIDGWYPDLVNEILTIKNHPQDSKKLTLTLTLNHSSGQAFSAARPSANNAASPSFSTSSGSDSGSNSGSSFSSDSDSSYNDNDFGDSDIPADDFSNKAPYDEFEGSDGYNPYDGPDSASNLDSLPPPPPFEDEEF